MTSNRFPIRLLSLAATFLVVSFGCSRKSTGDAASETDGGKATAPLQTAPAAPTRKPYVFFVFPQEGSTIYSTSTVVFGVDGMKVRPAGEDVQDRLSGHHHLIIDGSPVPAGTAVPADTTHIHFGKGQTETDVELTPGPHSLTIQFADGAHLSYGPEMATTVHVNVVPKPKKLGVAIVEPKDGAKVKHKFKVTFHVDGMKVHPAGGDPLDKTQGHHHLVIDDGPVPAGTMVPMDPRHLHFGKGQTEAEVELPPGPHKLTLQFADNAHVSYGTAMSATISVDVQAP